MPLLILVWHCHVCHHWLDMISQDELWTKLAAFSSLHWDLGREHHCPFLSF